MTQQVQPNATDRRRVLERNHAEVVALLASGATQPEVAQQFGVARSTVLRFVERNEQDIQRSRQRVDLATEDYHIAHKVNRIAGLDRLRQRIEDTIENRGLIERSTMTTKDGTVIERERFAREMSAELRAVYHAAAEELAQLPKPESTTVNIDKAILVRYVEGPSN